MYQFQIIYNDNYLWFMLVQFGFQGLNYCRIRVKFLKDYFCQLVEVATIARLLYINSIIELNFKICHECF